MSREIQFMQNSEDSDSAPTPKNSEGLRNLPPQSGLPLDSVSPSSYRFEPVEYSSDAAWIPQQEEPYQAGELPPNFSTVPSAEEDPDYEAPQSKDDDED